MKTKRLVESSIGVKTTERMARRIDGILKELPRDSAYHFRRKSVVGETEIQTGERTDVSLIATTAIDRDGEIVLPSGVEMDDYRANPIVLYGHDQNHPVGKNLWVKATAEGLRAKTYYAPRPKTYEGQWLPDFVFSMVQADVLRGKSIGFLPLEIREPTTDEVERFPTLERVISRCLLLEYSVVSVPSNPAALVEVVSKGVGLDFWNIRKVGQIQEPRAKKHTLADELKAFRLDTHRIADAVVKRLLGRWDV